MEKKRVVMGNLCTHELKDFIENVSMLKVSADDKLMIETSGHNAPSNTWLVTLWATDEDREELEKSLATGHLNRWGEQFLAISF